MSFDQENGLDSQWEQAVALLPADESDFVITVYGVPLTKNEADCLDVEEMGETLTVKEAQDFGAGEFTRELAA